MQGHDVRGWYLHEDNGFAASPTDSTYKPFGANTVIDRAEGTNNAMQVFEPGNRIAVDVVERLFEGSWSVTFDYTNPWWLNFIFGAPTTVDNADGSYTHTWSGDTMQTQRIGIGYEPSGKERILQGCVAATANARPSVGENGRITISGAYAKEEINDPASLTSQPSIDNEVMTFADATLSLGGSTRGLVQQAGVELNTNAEVINELGTRAGVDFAARQLVPRFNFTKINDGGEVNELKKLYGDTAASAVQETVSSNAREDATLTFDNGLAAGSGINQMNINLTSTMQDGFGQDGLGDPAADIEDNINRLVAGITVEATNEVATAE